MQFPIVKRLRRKVRRIAGKPESVVIVALILGAALMLANFVVLFLALTDRLPGGGHDWK